METAETREDFWVASGHHLVDRSEGGGLLLTDDLIKAYLARPELMPPDEACPVERGLHALLLSEPRARVTPAEIARMADEDARENLQVFLDFRDRLSAHATLEGAYVDLVRGGVGRTPPLFLQQLTHLIARNAFDACADAFVLRAAECFFRPQRVSLHEGSVLLADLEAIEAHEHDRHASPLLAMLGGPAVTELQVLTLENSPGYKGRSDAHDLVFDLTNPTNGRRAFAEAVALWTRHLMAFDLVLEPAEQIEEAFAWFIGLDAEASRIGDRVWRGKSLNEDSQKRILALFTFTIPAHARLDAAYQGRRGFALMAAGADGVFRMKPQNLVSGLPFARDPG